VPREVDDFKQPGDLYRLQPKDAQQRLVDNIAGSLAQVSRDDIIERSIEHFRKADAEFGRRIAEAVAARRRPAIAPFSLMGAAAAAPRR
jgi:catalase